MMQKSLISEIAHKYLVQGRVMQLATVSHDQPWIASVYYVADKDGNLYWLSWPQRRHSQEIANGSKVAAAVVIKADQPVIGLQVEGLAELITDEQIVKKMIDEYVATHHVGHKFYDNFLKGSNHHQMYCLTPTSIKIFDELNSPGAAKV